MLIEMTGQRSALEAINLTNLLKKRWTEDPAAYKIESKIKTERQRNRLNDMCSNRYK